MKILFGYAITVLLIFNMSHMEVYGLEKESIQQEKQIIIANKYGERFCVSKADHFFDGLDKEKTLRYSYFRYIGLLSRDLGSKDIYEMFINQIREKCTITEEEEDDIKEFFLKNYPRN